MADLVTIPFEALPGSKSLAPDALGVIPDGASVADALKVLQKKGFAHEAIPVLADAMPEREAVWWASQSCQRAGASLSSADQAAAEAAAAWVATPSEETAAAASAAAREAGFSGPGAFAAQAAALAEDPPVLAAGDPVGMSLAKQTAAGSVRLAALSEAELLPASVMPDAVGAAAAVAGTAASVAVAASAGDAAADADTEPNTDASPPPPEGTQPPAGTSTPESQPPSRKERKKASKASTPYLRLGQDIAAGTNHW